MSEINLNIRPLPNQENIFILELDGTLDTHTVPEFSEALNNYIQEGKTKVILNCRNLRFISSAGLGSLVGGLEEIEEVDDDGFIKIFGLSEEITDVFEMMGFSELFDIYESLDEAVDDL